MVTLKVDSSRSGRVGKTFTVRESGGIVTLGDVAGEFEGRVDPKEFESRSKEVVDYQYDGQPHSAVGDQLLIFVGGTPDEAGGEFSAARMKLNERGVFRFVGTPANESWSTSMTQSESERELGLR